VSAQASHTFAAEGIGRYNYRYTENVQVPRSETDEWMTSDLGQWPQLLLLLLQPADDDDDDVWRYYECRERILKYRRLSIVVLRRSQNNQLM